MPSNRFQLPPSLKERSFHLVGIKGTGMCALAELLVARGVHVTGSDVSERFYTDEILEELRIPVLPFAAESLDDNAEIIVRSAAYGNENPVLSAANGRGLPVLTYPQILGHLSTLFDSSAVAGVHGKTTTAALCGTLLKTLGLPATVVVGSAVANFNNRSTWIGGQEFLVAETCEYRRHFLEFSPKRIILTSVETDHQDYYPDYRSIHQAFMEFVTSLPPGGELIFCADDPGAAEVAAEAARLRPDILMTPYGETARGSWQICFSAPEPGRNRFRIASLEKEFVLNVPGRHLVLDTVAALALVSSCNGGHLDQEACFNALHSFRGSRRRSEIIGETQQILFMDDYAHHPTAVSTTLAGLRKFHPQRRLIVDFMPHTYSRTEALLEEFSECFDDADILILHPIYASAREAYTGGIRGEDLYETALARRPGKITLFFSTLREARDYLEQLLTKQDLMLTLGAGNNRPLGIELFEKFKGKLPMNSMTGFGYAENEENGVHMTVDIKSLNTRYLDIIVSLPPSLTALEASIRSRVQAAFLRGRVEVAVRVKDVEDAFRVTVDRSAAEAWKTALAELSALLDSSQPVTLDMLMARDGVLKTERKAEMDTYRSLLSPLLDSALGQVASHRQSEGVQLEADIESQIQVIEQALAAVEQRVPEMRREVENLLRSRFQEILGDESGEQRILSETAAWIAKTDINEEIVRLRVHIKAFREEAASGGGVGKKLDFLAQEMGREINTIGSKSSRANISRKVVDMKDALEKVREQLRNVE